MLTASADLRKCKGYANCVVTAPDFFDLGDNEKVDILHQAISVENAPLVAEAVASCPVGALKLHDA